MNSTNIGLDDSIACAGTRSKETAMSTAPSPRLCLALYLAQHWGAFVVPADATRRYILGRLSDATCVAAMVVTLWARQARADVGVDLERSRIVVIDIDVKHGIDGRDTLHELVGRYGPLPDTPRIATPHGGEQHWFRLPAGTVLHSSVAKLGAAIDVRANGVGFASGAGRQWYLDARPSETPLAELPPLWIAAIHYLEQVGGKPGDPFRLPDEVEKGGRNETLFKYACSMHARGVEWTLLSSTIHTANRQRCRPPLKDREVHAILKSVEAYPAGRRAA